MTGIFGFSPRNGPIIFLLASIWQLGAVVVAMRQALDYTSTWWAMAIEVIGFSVVTGIVMFVFPSISG